MNKSQNTISFALLVAMAITLSFSTGCKMGALPKLPVSLPKLPDMAKWKNNNFRLSRSKSDAVAPPSRTFDPKPSHFATLDAERKSPSNQMAANESRPIRQPYDVEEDTTDSDDSFGFPKNSKSLMGNNDFNVPDANEFRQAMSNTREKANDFVGSTQQAASQTIDQTKDFVAKTNNDFSAGSNDFSPRGGDFAPRNNQDFLNQSAEIARNVTQNQSTPTRPGWQSNNFNRSSDTVKNPVAMANQMAGNFQASTQKAVDNARQGVADFGQKAIDNANNGFQAAQKSASDFADKARDSINSTNQNLANAAGQFERSWQNSVDQAKQAANSIRNSNAFPAAGTNQTTPNAQGDFRPGPSQMQPAQAIANNNQQLQPVRQNQRSIEVTPQVEFGNQQRGNSNGQFASTTGGNSFQSPANNLNPRQPSNSGQAFSTNPQPSNQSNGGSRYPSTDFNPYVYGENEKVSQVTPIAEPAQRSASTQPNARTASLPSELLRGNSNYAPGSVRQLSPIK